MREYLVEAFAVAESSQYLITLLVYKDGIMVRGQTENGGTIVQIVPWDDIERAIINPIAIAIQMVEQQMDEVAMLQEFVGLAYQ